MTCSQRGVDSFLNWEDSKFFWSYSALGALASYLTPSRWRSGARFAPYMVFGVTGVLIDNWRRQEECRKLHPLPQWAIDQAAAKDAGEEDAQQAGASGQQPPMDEQSRILREAMMQAMREQEEAKNKQ